MINPVSLFFCAKDWRKEEPEGVRKTMRTKSSMLAGSRINRIKERRDAISHILPLIFKRLIIEMGVLYLVDRPNSKCQYNLLINTSTYLHTITSVTQ